MSEALRKSLFIARGRSVLASLLCACLLASLVGCLQPPSPSSSVEDAPDDASKASGSARADDALAKAEAQPPVDAVEDAKTAVEEGKTAVEDAKTPVEDAKTPVEEGKTAVEEGKTAVEDAKTAVEDAKTAVEDKVNAQAEAGVTKATEAAAALTGVESAEEPASVAGAGSSEVFPIAKGTSPMWGRGPSRNMVNPDAKNIPHEWDIDSGKNLKWKVALGSQSYGNPVVADGLIFVGTNNESHRNPAIKGDKGVVMCFQQKDGKFLWQAVHDKLSQGRVNDWPEQGVCSTGVYQDGKYYYVSNRCEIVCADAKGFTDGENDGPYKDEKYTSPIDGDFIWVTDMLNDYGVFPHNLATCSPVIVGDILYVITSNGVERDHITIPNPRAPSFMAVDKNTGEFLWGSREPGEGILHGQWSCPTYGVAGGVPQVLFPGGDGWLYSFEPKEGELLWKFDLNPKDSKWELGGLGTRNNIISTAVMIGDIVYLAVGQDPEHGEGVGHLYAINANGAKGDITKTGAIWHYGGEDFRRTISTVAIQDGLLYACDLSGFLHCLDQKTGKPYWVHDTLAAVWGSPTIIDGKVFLGDEDGDVVVLEHGKKMKLLFETNMQNSVYTTPVAVGDTLYIANRTTLYAISKTGDANASDDGEKK